VIKILILNFYDPNGELKISKISCQSETKKEIDFVEIEEIAL